MALLKRILANHGVDYMVSGKRATDSPNAGETLTLSAETIVDTTAPYDLVSRMRASFWVIGPLLARMHEARVSLPGGCAIGTRPVDFFLMGLEALGATLDIEAGYVVAKAPRGLVGGRVRFPHVSVGATHTIMMAATLAKGETVIENAACEPEVRNLAECLIKMGAKIEGAGTDTIRVAGVDRLGGATHRVLPDRIETGTYAMAVAAAGGDVVLHGAEPGLLQSALDALDRGRRGGQRDECRHPHRAATAPGCSPVDITTAPFPGFPTDLQAQFMALMTRAEGVSEIRETIFENRFMHVQELARLGADIHLDGQKATVTGVERLTGAPVMATDLRASVSLVIAGLAAEGETLVNRVYHLDRGFERLEQKLSACGAEIERLRG